MAPDHDAIMSERLDFETRSCQTLEGKWDSKHDVCIVPDAKIKDIVSVTGGGGVRYRNNETFTRFSVGNNPVHATIIGTRFGGKTTINVDIPGYQYDKWIDMVDPQHDGENLKTKSIIVDKAMDWAIFMQYNKERLDKWKKNGK